MSAKGELISGITYSLLWGVVMFLFFLGFAIKDGFAWLKGLPEGDRFRTTTKLYSMIFGRHCKCTNATLLFKE